MKAERSRSHMLKFNSTNETIKKQNSIQRQASKKYLKFKKSASQPAYFLDKSRLKKISDIYRAVSLQKLAKNYSLQKSKSLHNSVTPQKKNSFYNNGSMKKSTCLNTLNLNKVLQNTEKTKRLRLNRTQQNNNNSIESTTQNGTKFFLNQIQKLEQISQITIQKAFIGQYDHFFRSLKEECFGRKGYNSEIKSLVSKFCCLMQICQQRTIKINQKQLKSRYDKIEIDFSNTNSELKKKSFKMQLLIKEINQLKDYNMKISKELTDLRQQKKENVRQRRRSTELDMHKLHNYLQISNVIELTIHQKEASITTPIYQQHFSERSQNLEFKMQSKGIQGKSNQNIQQQGDNKFSFNERLEMIKKIRNLEKKHKQLVKTLLILKSDGINVQRAFQEVVSGKQQVSQVDQNQLDLVRDKMPSYIKKIKNKDSYEADNSIIQSIDGLTVRYFDGEPQQQYFFYPIKNKYKSKPLTEQMQDKLKLDFNALYEDQEYYDGQSQEVEYQQPPTI